MKSLSLTLILIPFIAFSQANVNIKSGSLIGVQTSNGDISIESNMTNAQLTQELGVNPPPPSGINSFTGPNGCINCVVPPNTPFNVFWDVTNVGLCTASNTINHPSWSGTVQPFGGGTGAYQKNISNGISSNATFTLNCPAPAKSTTYKFYYVKEITKEITVPPNTRLVLHNYGESLTILNIIVGSKTKTPKILSLPKAVGKKIYFTEIYTPKLDDVSITVTHSESDKLPSDIKVWSFITEVDPRVHPGPSLYKNGKCESLDVSPNLRLSTFSVMKEKNSKDVCMLEPEKKYYLTNVYLKRDISEINNIIREHKLLRNSQ
ncbi:MAG: hypothetical protein QM478_11715 [Flavobacteriaceae bacterium]